jgi:IS5 family transposase
LTAASGLAEREAALLLLDRLGRRSDRRLTLGADKAYDVTDFVSDLRNRSVTPHITRNDYVTKTGKRRKTAIDGRTLRHPGYGISQCCRKQIEEVFGWVKTQAGLAKKRFRGTGRVQAALTLAVAAYNLIRLSKLLAAPS